MNFTFTIPGDVFAGIISGATAGAIYAIVLAGIESISRIDVSPNSFGDFGNVLRGWVIYVPLGMVVGLILALLSLPWWTTFLVFVLMLLALILWGQENEEPQDS